MTSSPDLSSSELRFGHYLVERGEHGEPVILGAGGMGVTYKAVDERLKVSVALKVIEPTRMHDPEAQALFLREARAAARVRHPNVGSILYLKDTPGSCFFAMEYLEGDPLDRWHRKHAPLPIRQAVLLVKQIAAGLEAIHAAKIVHRDLKPGNVMVVPSTERPPEESVQCKIIDFGLARAFTADDGSEGAPSLGFRGTLLYASPEQCEERRDLDGRSDLYALGCILWELLVGKPPFRADSQRELLNFHVSADAPIAELAGVPAEVRELACALLAKQRERRPSSAAAVVDWIREIEPKIDPAARAIPAVDRPPVLVDSGRARGRDRGWLPLAATALVLLAGTILTLFAYLRAGRPSNGRDALPASAAAQPESALLPPPSKLTIAVLPFAAASGEKDDELTADGIQEDLIVNLVRVRELRVIGRTSTLPFRGPRRNLPEIARRLGAGSIVEGNVRADGPKVRVSVTLTDSLTGATLWAGSFDGETTDLFELQGSLARRIALSVEAKLSPEDLERLDRRPTASLSAWRHYQRARELRRRALAPTVDDYRAVIAELEAAIRNDPGFALAHSRLCSMHGELYWFQLDPTPQRRALVLRSLEAAKSIGPHLPEVLLAEADWLYKIERNYRGALALFRQVAEARPHDAEVLTILAAAARRCGEWDFAEECFRTAAELSPDDALLVGEYCWTLGCRRKYARAVAWYQRLSATYPDDLEIREATATFRLHHSGDWARYRSAVAVYAAELPEVDRAWIFLMEGNHEALYALFADRLAQIVGGSRTRLPGAYYAGWALHLARDPRARATLEIAQRVFEESAQPGLAGAYERACHAQVLALLGRQSDAHRLAAEAVRDCPRSVDAVTGSYVIASAALARAWTGDVEGALGQLESALAEPIDLHFIELQRNAQWTPLRGHPRFARLLESR